VKRRLLVIILFSILDCSVYYSSELAYAEITADGLGHPADEF